MNSLIDTGPLFFCAERTAKPGRVCIVGCPFDGSVSFRPGSRFGPDAIRMVSEGLESYSPALDRDLEDEAFSDLGNISAHGNAEAVSKAVFASLAEFHAFGLKPLLLGGEHSLSAGAVRAALTRYPSLCLIQLDAHADLRDGYLDEKFSHASAMRRCLDVLPPRSLFQLGIRSGLREEFEEMRREKRLMSVSAESIRTILAQLGDRPIYLTIDLDVFDPAVMPGTGTPEAGGIFWPQFESMLSAIPRGRIVAADVVELAPMLDSSGCSTLLAAKVVRELVLHMR